LWLVASIVSIGSWCRKVRHRRIRPLVIDQWHPIRLSRALPVECTVPT
jgi:hypothetical protein